MFYLGSYLATSCNYPNLTMDTCMTDASPLLYLAFRCSGRCCLTRSAIWSSCLVTSTSDTTSRGWNHWLRITAPGKEGKKCTKRKSTNNFIYRMCWQRFFLSIRIKILQEKFIVRTLFVVVKNTMEVNMEGFQKYLIFQVQNKYWYTCIPFSNFCSPGGSSKWAFHWTLKCRCRMWRSNFTA